MLNHNVNSKISFALLLLSSAAHGLELHVAVTGSDDNSGSAQKPLATLNRAAEAVRENLPDATEDITVFIHAGVYRQTETLRFTEADAGLANINVKWISADGSGKARISGSCHLTGWQRHSRRIWKTEIPSGITFDTLYESGKRLRKARWPNYRHDSAFPDAAADYLTTLDGSPKLIDNQIQRSWFKYAEEEAPPSDLSISQLKVNIFPWGICDWHRWNCAVTAINRETRRIEFNNMGDSTEILSGARYFLEDALALLDQPGEFFFDHPTRTLYCIPLRKKHPDKLNITLPLLKTLVELCGTDSSNPVRNLQFEGLRFEESDAISPSLFWWKHAWGRSDHALLKMSNTTGITVRNCHFVNSGRHGILLVGDNTHNSIYGCLVENIGISGITISNRFKAVADQPTADTSKRNFISNTLIRHVGQLGLYAACIELMNTSANEISFCELSYSPRYAVTLRGNTGTQYGPPITTDLPPTSNNYLHHLRIHRCGQDSGDMGALHAANINNPDGGSTNTFEQITITDTAAVSSMMDWEPDGIFLDWPKMAMDQIFRNIYVLNTQGAPLRSNGPDNAQSALLENVSWKDGFDETKMDYAAIGLKPDFPSEYAHVTTGSKPRSELPAEHTGSVHLHDFPTNGIARLFHKEPLRCLCSFEIEKTPQSNIFRRLFSWLTVRSERSSDKTGSAVGRLHGDAAIISIPSGCGNALKLNGKDAYIELPSEINLGSGDFSVTAWIWKKRPGNYIIFAKGNGFGAKDQWSLGWEYPPQARNISFRTNNLYFNSAPGSVPACRWTHIAFVRRGSTGQFYINGALSGVEHDMSSVNNLSNDLPLMIGRRQHQPEPAYFNGMLDDLRIYNTALDINVIEHLARQHPQQRKKP
jgi:hypothetical protein